jgi:cytosine/adenosine deaminase-related metal-dependent hydrolase
MATTVIRDAHVISMDERIGTLSQGDVLFEEGGPILAVGPALPVPEGTTEVDGRDRIVLPGFIDSHRHVWQTALRGIATDYTVIDYRNMVRGAIAPRCTPEDMYAGTLLGSLEALNSGITTLADLSPNMNSPEHADAVVDAHRAAGMRVLLSHGTPGTEMETWYGDSTRRHPADIARLAGTLPSEDGLIRLGMCVRPPHLVTREVLIDDFALARSLGVHLSMDGGLGGGCWGGPKWEPGGLQPAHVLADLGLLGPDLTMIHCNNLIPAELALIAGSGTSVSIAPDTEMNCGHGMPATLRLLEQGIRPSLSIDIVVQVGGDMFGAMRTVLNAARGMLSARAYEQDDPIWTWNILAKDVLGFATVQGAAAVGLADAIGSLTPGKRADIVCLRSDPFNLEPLNNPIGSVVMAAHPGNVERVYVDGRCVKSGGVLHSPHAGSAVELARRSRDRLLAGVDVSREDIRRQPVWMLSSAGAAQTS